MKKASGVFPEAFLLVSSLDHQNGDLLLHNFVAQQPTLLLPSP